MLSQDIRAGTINTLHLRPVGELVMEAKKYASEAYICYQGNQFNAKSVMGLLSLAAKKAQGNAQLITDGKDEADCMRALIKVMEVIPEE